MEEQKELSVAFRNQQEKYVYYIVALAITAIGFSIYQTIGQPLNWKQLPLGIAVSFWGISVYCGLTFLKYAISGIYNNIKYLDIIHGKFPRVGSDPIKISAAKEIFNTVWDTDEKTASRLFTWQQRLFYFGAILFIAWHVIEMYFSNNC